MAILIVVNVVVLTKLSDTSQKLEEQQSMTVKERSASRTASKRVTELSEQKAKLSSSLREERIKTDKMKSENKRLKANLQAKKEREAQAVQLASAQVAVKPIKAAPVAKVSGNKQAWLAASGIPESEWQYVDYIVSKESGWNPCAYNPGLSDCSASPTSACGLAQSLPCGKQSGYGHWTDPVANLKWQYEYVKGRYGSYAAAYNFWLSNKWY